MSLHPTHWSLNTDYVVVIRLNAATGECRLCLNPSVEATGFVDSTDAPPPSLIQAFAFRQTGPPDSTACMGVLTVDRLKVATTFAEMVGVIRPLLGFQRSGNNLRLSWPTGQGFSLRRAIALPATGWSNVQFVPEGAGDISNIDLTTRSSFLRMER